MNTNYNREAFVRSLEKLCLLHRGIFSFSEDVTYDVKKAVPEGFDPLMYFTFKPVYTFEAYGNSHEHLNGRYDTNDKECIFHLQKTLLLTLYETKRLSFNQYQYAVKLLEKKFRQR